MHALLLTKPSIHWELGSTPATVTNYIKRKFRSSQRFFFVFLHYIVLIKGLELEEKLIM